MEWRNSRPPITGAELDEWREAEKQRRPFVLIPKCGGWVVTNSITKNEVSKVITERGVAVDLCMSMNRTVGG